MMKHDLATKVLTEVMHFRRMISSSHSCRYSPCELCMALHLPKVISAMEKNDPITFVLPAFPGKSPNLAKVLGPLPDLAERCSLEFLDNFCNRIKKLYSPGARVLLCSDGRVFSDVIGMREHDVTLYHQEIAFIIKDLSLTSLSIFNLDHVYEGLSFQEMRDELIKQYGKDLNVLKVMVRQGGKPDKSKEDEDIHRLYCGITRFLYEDSLYPGQTKTRSSIQRDCRRRAYEVIQRSHAWSELIADHFKNAVRLSIHPQTCGSKKMGIRLMIAENWMTPWHGVAVERGGDFCLMKRSEAQALGARVVYLNGRASHYTLTN